MMKKIIKMIDVMNVVCNAIYNDELFIWDMCNLNVKHNGVDLGSYYNIRSVEGHKLCNSDSLNEPLSINGNAVFGTMILKDNFIEINS